MTKSKKRGELVYIPSSVILYQLGENNTAPDDVTREWVVGDDSKIKGPVLKYKKTEKPMNVLCIEDYGHGYKKIIYESETWLVRERDVYSAKKGDI